MMANWHSLKRLLQQESLCFLCAVCFEPIAAWHCDDAAPSYPSVIFKVNRATRNFSESVRHCVAHGMTIASVHSQAENDAIVKLVMAQKSPAYLGATDTAKNGVWTWEDASLWDYQSSKNSGLGSAKETHLVMYHSGVWHDWGKGEDKLGVVCRKDNRALFPSDVLQ